MATPTIDNLLLPNGGFLVLPDAGDKPVTGTITHRSTMGGGHFKVGSGGGLGGENEYAHVFFVREMAAEVEVGGVKYLAMGRDAVVGLIPD